jgi:ABC-type sugar transport system permease subunit
MSMFNIRMEAGPRGLRNLSRLQRREAWFGFAFISPWLLGFLLFTILPMIAALVFSVTQFNLLDMDEFHFIGLQNYIRVFSDPQVIASLWITLRFALFAIPLAIGLPLGLAVLVNSKYLLGKNFFRTLFYMPIMIPVVAVVVIFGGVLNSESGWINRALDTIGIQGPSWFQDENWVLPALAIMGFWTVGNTMLVMLAGMQNVPTELYEAAKVEGAGPFTMFWNITLPMISPIIFYNLVLALIATFQYFTQAFVISNGRGDPNGSTMFYNLYLYKTAFAFLDMGYGAALAWVLFAIVLVLTVALFRTSSRWVYYAGGE